MKSFLILGHKGYLGANLCNMLMSRGYEVSVLPGKVTLESIPILAKKYFSKEQIIINCMGSGVSNNSDAKDLSINGTLIEPLLSSFSESTASKFVNFGTKYELPDMHTPQKRLPYVNSKILGSEICNRYIDKDKRISLRLVTKLVGL